MMPPCKRGGTPCAKRKPGCQSTCPEMKVYQLMHAVDQEEKKRVRAGDEATAMSVERMRRKRK